MGNAGICERCGGRGIIWTGEKRITCPAKGCDNGRLKPTER